MAVVFLPSRWCSLAVGTSLLFLGNCPLGANCCVSWVVISWNDSGLPLHSTDLVVSLSWANFLIVSPQQNIFWKYTKVADNFCSFGITETCCYCHNSLFHPLYWKLQIWMIVLVFRTNFVDQVAVLISFFARKDTIISNRILKTGIHFLNLNYHRQKI